MKTIGPEGLARHVDEEIEFYGHFTPLRFEFEDGKDRFYVRVMEEGRSLDIFLQDGDEIDLWYRDGMETRKVRL